jgi:hypothetical protein
MPERMWRGTSAGNWVPSQQGGSCLQVTVATGTIAAGTAAVRSVRAIAALVAVTVSRAVVARPLYTCF